MGIEGLDWQIVTVPLSGGLDQGHDARALQPPALAKAVDTVWEERGGIQLRYPFDTLGLDIFGGGSVSDVRCLVSNGSELLLFSKTALYSRLVSQSKWVPRGTHLAIAIDERPVFVTTGDQRDCDRAELGDVVLTAYVDAEGLWVGARDKATGAVLLAPTLANNVGTRPRFVVCSTKILLFWIDTAAGDLEAIAIDPASPATAIAGAATTVIAATNSYYDVTKVPGSDTAIGAVRHTTTTSHKLFKVTQALAVTTSTKTRTADGPLAVSCDPTGATLQVIRANGTNIQGDRITVSSLADAATGQAIGTATGTPVNQIAAAHRSVASGGAYTCAVFWSAEETAGTVGFQCKYNTVTTAGTIGTQAVLGLRLGVASRAFDYNGTVYAWFAFAGRSDSAGMGEPLGLRAQLQNTYFLYDDAGALHSQCVRQRGGGFSASTGFLPQVSRVTGSTTYAWCGIERRVVPLGAAKHTGYADRGPVDVTFTFDSDKARRCARLGETLYVAGGIVKQYDRDGLVEVGFLVYPWLFASVQVGVGLIPDGKYSYFSTMRWQNATGEKERSTTATGEQLTISGGPAKVDFSVASLHVTFKQGARRPPAQELWRSQVNPTVEAPFYLDTSNDPGALSGDNRYIANAPTSAFAASGLDNLTDADLADREQYPSSNTLEPMAPPPASIIAAYGDRLFLGGVAGQPRRIWYSRLRGDGEIASFHDQNSFEVPDDGGEPVAIGFMDGRPVVFCETAIFLIDGDGYDNTGGGNNYSPRRVSADVGCRDHDSLAELPTGLALQTDKGKYVLNRGWTLSYIGLPVKGYDAETVVGVVVDEKTHQIRWLTAQRLIVCDYEIDPPQWTEWSIVNGRSAVLWNGAHHVLTVYGPYAEQTSYALVAYGLDVEIPWIAPAARFRLRKLKLLGECRSAFSALPRVRVRISYDYKPEVIDDRVWVGSAATPAGDPLDLEIMPSIEEIEAVKVRLTVVGEPTQAVLDIGFPGDLSAAVDLNSPISQWTAQLTAIPLGELGNDVSFAIGFQSSATAAVEVRDGQWFDPLTEMWTVLDKCVGVRVTGNDTTATVAVAVIEERITSVSKLAQVTTNHAAPHSTINFATMNNIVASSGLNPSIGGFHDGTFAAPITEGVKLTSLALELAPLVGLHKRLPPEQRI